MASVFFSSGFPTKIWMDFSMPSTYSVHLNPPGIITLIFVEQHKS
jgi:hypothetical protein